MLLTVNFDKDLIDVEGVAIRPMVSLQPTGVQRSEFDAPQADGLAADNDASLGLQVFNVSMAKVETIVEPDGVGNDVWWESVALVCIHRRIISFQRVKLAIPKVGRVEPAPNPFKPEL
ncbi:hypothetical protein [Congregibacter sp.]|jgi:hypothetical protein|uniref:hypothetical protein n=1 Tax=Congregibacter sp. TaxID=2744308 RepID=UPI0039E66658